MNHDAVVRSPVGVVGILTDGESLLAIDFLPADTPERAAENVFAGEVVTQLLRYFDDPSWRFQIPLKPAGTDHQCRVWRELCEIPSGEVTTYGELAGKIESGARAVGNACRHNPIPIVVPCHRVVAASGIGGYAGDFGGGKVGIKDQLLRHENPGQMSLL